MDLRIEKAIPADAAEILALQRLAYQSEARLYDDFSLPPLTETLAQLESLFADHVFLKAVEDAQIVGSVRAVQQDATCRVGRLIVRPDCWGRGIGASLMEAIEARFPEAKRFELFTGHRSLRTIALYERLGYRRFKDVPVHERLILVYLEKTR